MEYPRESIQEEWYLGPRPSFLGRVGRRVSQIGQILFSDRFSSSEKIQQSMTDRYSSNKEIEFYKKYALTGLDHDELIGVKFANKFLPQNPTSAVIGCGAGREAFHLEKMGHTVTGIDQNPKMVEAAQEVARQLGSHSTWSTEIPKNKKFDFIYISTTISSHILGRRNRVQFFKNLKNKLNDQGLLFYYPCVQPFKLFSNQWFASKIMKWRFSNDHNWEKGDTLSSFLGHHNNDHTLLFLHMYQSLEEVCSTLEEAGLDSYSLANETLLAQHQGQAVLENLRNEDHFDLQY